MTPPSRALALACLLLGCAADAPQPSPPPQPVATRSGGSPLAGLAPADEVRWHGVVEEHLAAGGYSYMAVRDGAALRWVAVMGPGVAPGTAVRVQALGTRKDFHSPRLDRDFDELVFATVEHDPTPQRGPS